MKLDQPSTCHGCKLYKIGKGFSVPEGSGTNKVLIVGDFITDREVSEGLPLRPGTQSGAMLEKALRGAGLSRDQFVVTTLIRCNPPYNDINGWYQQEAIFHCTRTHLASVIERYRPRVIVALGALVTKVLTGMSGKKQNLEMLQGYAIPSPDYPGLWVMPIYSPSFVAQGQSAVFPVLVNVLRRATIIARDPNWQREELSYITDGGPAELEQFYQDVRHNPELITFFDFETAFEEQAMEPGEMLIVNDEDVDDELKTTKPVSTNQDITQVNLSLYQGEGLAVQFNPLTRPIIQKILNLPNEKGTYNGWMFDLLVARYNNLTVRGRVHDAMWAMHHLYPDIPGKRGKIGSSDKDEGSLMNLQYAASFAWFPMPWKHMIKGDPGFYGCCDSDANLRVHWFAHAEMERLKLLDSYERLVVQLMPVLNNMQRRGIPLNVVKLREFIRMLTEKQKGSLSEIQPLIPADVLPVKQKKGLKRVPVMHCPDCGGTGGERFAEGIYCARCDGHGRVEATEGLTLRPFNLETPEPCGCFKTRVFECLSCKGDWKRGKKKSDPSTDCTECAKGKVKVKAADPLCTACGGAGYIGPGKVMRWCQPLAFKPTSSPQLKSYAAYKRHSIPKNSKKETCMDKETLQRMAKTYDDTVYRLSVNYREYTKMKGTYGEGWLRNAMQFDDRRVRTQFTFAPATLQLSSVSPNVQNDPSPVKYGDLALQFASAIEAKPNRVLLSFDFKSFHAQTLGLNAGDMQYIRLARMDIHSFLVAHLVKHPEARKLLTYDDEKLLYVLKQIKKQYPVIREKQAKPAVHGIGFGRGAGSLYRANIWDPATQAGFKSSTEAQQMIDIIEAEFPIVAKYRNDTPKLAHQFHHLRNHYGAVRWFWDVMKWNYAKKRFDHGDDYEKTIAYQPASDAFGYVREVMLRMEENQMNEIYGLINNKHDSLEFDCPAELAEEARYTIAREMERPSTVLFMPNGEPFWCGVECKMGPNKAELVEVKCS